MPDYSSRKYVDLILETSSKWANWDPPIPVEVGTYGTINKYSGALDREGNIYSEEFRKVFEEQCPDLDIDNYKPVVAPPEKSYIVYSKGVQQSSFGAEASVDVLNLASASIKAEWNFPKKDRGALLVMHSPRQTHIPIDTILKHLYDVPELKDKYLVTDIFSCPAYSLFLSNKSGEKLQLALTGSLPVPIVPGVSAGGSNSLSWYTNIETSLMRTAVHPEGEYAYVPLYSLKRRRPPIWERILRDAVPVPPVGDDFWIDVQQPWDPLDEDGEEDLVYDEDEDEEAD